MLTALALVLSPVASQASDGSGEGSGGSDTQLTGVVESLPQGGLIGDWVVNGVTVHVTDATEIDQEDATISVGSSVDVEGIQMTDGSIDAQSIQGTEGSDDDSFGNVEFAGTVESMPSEGVIGDWVVSGTTVHVTEATQIEGEDGVMPSVGSTVEVKGLAESDGSVTASSIDLSSGSTSSDFMLTGALQHRPANVTGTWRIARHAVAVTRSTKIVRNGHELTRGSTIRVLGSVRANGTIKASKLIAR
jgi:hypothetical protein